MIVEGILTTTDSAGQINVAPMGPIVHGDFETLTLRPFAGSTTFENLTATRTGVFHIVDRVNLIAEAAIRQLQQLPETTAAQHISGVVLSDCCRWFEISVVSIDITNQRSEMECDVVHSEERRPYWGFNRARHAVIEAAILSTRLHLIPREEVETQFRYLKPAVEKTGGVEERNAFQMLTNHVDEFYSGESQA